MRIDWSDVANPPDRTDLDKAKRCMYLFFTACITAKSVEELTTDDDLKAYFAIPDGSDPTPAQKEAFVRDVSIHTLAAFRHATNESKSQLQVVVAKTISAQGYTNAYSLLLARTSAPDIKIVLKSLQATFDAVDEVPLKLAAERLSGRGFSGLLMIQELIDRVHGQAQQDLARIFASYPGEVDAVCDTVAWLTADPLRLHYSFYVGIPQQYAQARYIHLVGVAAAVLPNRGGLTGAHKRVTFSPEVRALFDTIKEAVSGVALAAYDNNWDQVLTTLGAAIKTRAMPQ